MTPQNDKEQETVWVVKGYPAEETADKIPVTVFDVGACRRVRYQYAPRDQLAVMLGRDTAKWRAIWVQPHPKDRGEWRLLDIVPDKKEVV